jgi:hypothetical protein
MMLLLSGDQASVLTRRFMLWAVTSESSAVLKGTYARLHLHQGLDVTEAEARFFIASEGNSAIWPCALTWAAPGGHRQPRLTYATCLAPGSGNRAEAGAGGMAGALNWCAAP